MFKTLDDYISYRNKRECEVLRNASSHLDAATKLYDLYLELIPLTPNLYNGDVFKDLEVDDEL